MIFCVEDDRNILDLMLYALHASGFCAEGFETAADFWNALQNEKPELVLLDIMLPDEEGLSVLKELKGQSMYAQIPVIMATAKGTEFDKVIGLDLGADDYLAKPFGMMEMVARVKAVLRRTTPKGTASALQFQTIELNEASHRVSAAGKPVELTMKEYELLRIFLQNPGMVLTRDQLLSAVWDSDFQGETRTVDVHIASLRTKLAEAGEYIRTVRGVGYRLEDKL